MDFKEECLEKIENGIRLTEKELCELVEKHSIYDEYVDSKSYDISVNSVIEIHGRYFSILWGEGRTNYDPNNFFEQPVEVEKHEHKEVITITTMKWTPIERKENEGFV